MKVDVALFALADLAQDARTLNLARALCREGLRVGVFSSSTQSLRSDPFEFVEWSDPGGSAFSRWRSYNHASRSLNVDAKVIAAMDLFALTAASSFLNNDRSLVYDMREFYFALGPLQGRGIKQKIIAQYERVMLKRVDRVMVSGPLDAEVVTKHYGLTSPPHVLLNTPPFAEPVDSSYLRDKFQIPADHIIALYQGVVHNGRGIAPFIRFLSTRDNIELCVVGEGPGKGALKELGESLGVDGRVHWHDSVPYDSLHEITCSADVGLCLIEPVSLSYEYALPNKLFEYMMAGIPSLVTDLPALRKQVQETPVGMLVERSLSPSAIADSFDQVTVQATYDAMVEHTRSIKDLAYERQATLTADLYRELL